MISALFIFSTLYVNSTYAFGTIGNRVAPSTYSTQPSARFSPLFVASADVTNGEPIAVMVKSLEAEMARAEKKYERHDAELNKFKSKIQDLEKREMQYLEGSSLGRVEQNFTETTAFLLV